MKELLSIEEKKKRKSASDKAWRLANKEKVKEYIKTWRLLNAEKEKEIRKNWRLKNIEKEKEQAKAWNLSNSELVKLKRHRRRARIRNASGTLSNYIIDRLMLLQKELCVVCKVNLKEVNYHLDHIQPLSKGGTNDDENVQLLCQSCNCSKGAKDPIEFMQSKGFLF